MNKTKIEWCDYTANPVKGYCPMACPYCYARAMYDRFHWDKRIRFEPADFNDFPKIKEPSRIFVGSTIELFGEWIEDEWMRLTLCRVRAHPQHTFIFLTKRPERLAWWNPWPDNAWVGVSCTDYERLNYSVYGDNCLQEVDAKIKFISFEPLLGLDMSWAGWQLPHYFKVGGISWVIIGAQTGKGAKPPKPERVQEIITAADSAGLPVFLKDNLKWPEKRQEYPVATAHGCK